MKTNFLFIWSIAEIDLVVASRVDFLITHLQKFLLLLL